MQNYFILKNYLICFNSYNKKNHCYFLRIIRRSFLFSTVVGNPGGGPSLGVQPIYFGGVLRVVKISSGSPFCVLLHFYNLIFRTSTPPSTPLSASMFLVIEMLNASPTKIRFYFYNILLPQLNLLHNANFLFYGIINLCQSSLLSIPFSAFSVYVHFLKSFTFISLFIVQHYYYLQQHT